MSQRSWTEIQAGVQTTLLPSSLVSQLRTAVDSVVAPLLGLLSSLQPSSQAASLESGLAAALRPLFDGLDALSDFQGGVHALLLPIVGEAPVPPLPPDALNVLRALTAREPQLPGGPLASLYAQMAASLEDEDDEDRPIYPTEDELAALCIVVGGSAVSDALERCKKFDSLLKSVGFSLSLDAHILPCPQNLRVRIAAGPGDISTTNVSGAEASHHYRLQWNHPVVYDLSELVSGSQLSIRRVHVLCSEVPITEDQNLESLIVATVEYRRDSLDVSVSGLTAPELYWAVCYDVQILEDFNGRLVESRLNRVRLSNVVRTRTSERGPRRRGNAPEPNWRAIQTPDDLVPVNALRAQLELLLGKVLNIDLVAEATASSRAVDAWIRSAERDLAAAQKLLDKMEAVAAAFSTGVYVYGFEGVGGTAMLYQEVWRALFDTSTRSRPPFTGPSSAAAMLLLVAGGRAAQSMRVIVSALAILGVDVQLHTTRVARYGDRASSDGDSGVMPGSYVQDPDPSDILDRLKSMESAALDRAAVAAQQLGLLDDASDVDADAFLSVFGTESLRLRAAALSDLAGPAGGAEAVPDARQKASELLRSVDPNTCED